MTTELNEAKQKIAVVETEIAAVKFVLRSFVLCENETDRWNHLRQHANEHAETYMTYYDDKKGLQAQLDRLQEEKNLLLKSTTNDMIQKKARCDTYFQVTATILDSKKSKGYRNSMYKTAQHFVAYFPLEGRDQAIYYKEGSSDLFINLLFCSRRDAELFQNELLNFAFVHSHFKEKLELNEEIVEVEVTNQPDRIFHRHYVPSDNNESPEISLNDILGSPSASVVTIGKSDCILQSLEEERIVCQFDSKWYKCHLISAKNLKFKNNPNNIIYASHHFHQLFDGLNTSRGVGVLLKFIGFGDMENVFNGVEYVTRQKVFVEIQFRDRDIATSFGRLLKTGTTRIDDYSYHSFLYAEDGETMKYCLESKYKVENWLENMSSVSED